MALARALAVEPKVLLLDEPFGALDAKVRKELRDWLRRLHDEVHVTTLFVTHDQEEALEVSDEIVVINQGRVEQVGSPDDLYDKPVNDFVMSFLGPVTTLDGRLVRPHDIEIFTSPVPEAIPAHVARMQRVGFEVRVEMSTPGVAGPRGRRRRPLGRRTGVGPDGRDVGAADPRPERVAQPARGIARVAGGRTEQHECCCPRLIPPPCKDAAVQISAKTDYAVRALLSLAAREPELVKIDTIVREQALPRKFVEAILGELRRAGIVRSQRGAEGGYALARPAREITLGAVIRAVDGPLAEVRGLRPHETTYAGSGRAPAPGLGRGAGQPAPRARRDHAGPGAQRRAARPRAAAERRSGRLAAALS